MKEKSEKQNACRVKLFYAHKWAESETIMKKLMLVSMVLLLTMAAYGGNTSGSTAEERGISLGIIIDTSPSSQKTWNMFQAAILEMACQLRVGDKITIYTAHPGKPRLRIICVLGPEGNYNPSDITKETKSFSKELLFGANLSRAVEFVFKDFYREINEYQHCLVILSKGDLNSEKVTQIKRLVVNFKNNDWPVRFICEPTQASRNLLVAANNQQLDLRMLDKPELTKWIDTARMSGVSKLSSTNDASMQAEKVAEGTVPVHDFEDGKAGTTDDETVKVEIVNISSLPMGNTGISDINDNATKELTNDEEGTAKLEEKTDITNKRRAWLIILSSIVLIAGSWFCLKKLVSTGSLGEQLRDQIDGQEDLQQRLISLVGSQRQDMGDIATLGEVVIGKGMGSSIYIDNENVEERHLRIFKSGRKVKIQNLASSPISVDGVQLNRRQKADLIFPAEIELAGGVIVSLIAEDVNFAEEERGDNYEE